MASTGVARVGNNLPSRNFIPEVWSMRMQAKFYASTVVPAIANTDWEGEIRDSGSVVHIRIRPTVPVDDYVVNEDLSYSDLEDEKFTMNIDKAKMFAFKCDDVDKAQMDIKVMEEATTDANHSMKIAVDVDVLANTHASATTDLISGGGQLTKINILEYIVDVATELNELNVPKEGRWGVLAPWVYGLINKSDLKDASLAGDGKSILRSSNDYVGTIAGISFHESNLLAGASTASSAAPTNLMFGTKHAISFASQLKKVERIKQLQNTFGAAVRGLNVYGYQVTKADALVRVQGFK